MKKIVYWFFYTFLSITISQRLVAQTVFPPPNTPPQLQATRIESNLTIDGKLDEPEWQRAKTVSGFTQVEPNQGNPADFDTRVRVLYDARNLYIAAVCLDPTGRKGVRVPDLRRDFDWDTNDIFGIAIDAFQDKRNAMAFQTNPYGAQRDLLSFDDNFFDREWDALWKVRTQRNDSGWTAEMLIPWSTVRYPKLQQARLDTARLHPDTTSPATDSVPPRSTSGVPSATLPSEQNQPADSAMIQSVDALAGDKPAWGIIFVRRARRTNEISAWPAYPRSFNPYRMSYAGLLTGIEPPPPSPNIRIQPYVLASADRERKNDETITDEVKPKLGGEVKWAVNPNSVLDLTFNTDFAQADVDRQVQNLTRFSVYFPERRQFFLENASLFLVGQEEAIQPFFSRRIGLDDNGNPIPIDAGARFVSRTTKRSYGGLLMRQRETDFSPGATFAVGRYSKNIGEQNRIGGLITARFDDAMDSLGAASNLVGATDGFFRITQPLTFSYMVSGSSTSGKGGDGIAAYTRLAYFSNQWYAAYSQSIITSSYTPGTGFIYDSDIINTKVGGYPVYRPKWKPKFVRSLEPGVFVDLYHRASDRKFQQMVIEMFPIWVLFQDGGLFEVEISPTRQRLDALDLPFAPLGVSVAAGDYTYTRYSVRYTSDLSKKLAFSLYYYWGGYYDGKLQTWTGFLRYSPVPNVLLSLDYERNITDELGENSVSQTTELITPQIRLALNPRLQLIGFYQKNTVSSRDVWNVRLSWEFQPLSFLYLVYNNNTVQGTDRLQSQQLLGKVTYLKQF